MTALRLDLSIPPDWSRIDPAREAVGLLVFAVTHDGDLREALAMVSEELLENAIKYSKPDSTVSLSLRDEASVVVVAVQSALDDARAGLVGALRERLAWMKTFATPLDAYTAAMTRVYRRETAANDEAGLGMVRIAYEGRCGLEIDVSEPGKVTVRAACRVG